MTLGHGRPQFVALDISKSARSAVRLSPQLGEEPKKMGLAATARRVIVIPDPLKEH
ncbi:hypothetical protein [Thermomonas fusca]|uniref:hypothetical protein n=1 Tax=Thermomonas fusca TaxID=215690 RepID=UPI00146DDC60|nr:hypothetical protein [Thermomonas fusca]